MNSSNHSNRTIVIVGPVYPYRGGIAHHTTLLATALAKKQSRVNVISFRRQYPRWLYPGQSDRDPSADPIRVPAEYLLDPIFPWTWRQTAHRIARLEPDLVVFPWWTTFWAPAFSILAHLLQREGQALLFLVHNVLPHEPTRLDTWLTRLVLRHGSDFIVSTEREKSRLLALVPSASAMVYPHPTYPMFAAQRIPKENARQRLGLPPGLPVVLFFGIVRRYKGLTYLLDAAALLREQKRPVCLVVAGEFWEDQATYVRQIKDLDLGNHVRLENRYIPNDDVSIYFSVADVLVAPYVEGTQSGAIAMAQGFGVPIVTTSRVAEGACPSEIPMRVVAPGDATALAVGIREIVEMPQNDFRLPDPLEGNRSWEGLADLIIYNIARKSR